MAYKYSMNDRRQLRAAVDKKLGDNLLPDEQVRVIITIGRAEAALVATDRRVLILKKVGVFAPVAVSSWGYSQLAGIQRHKGLVMDWMCLTGPGFLSPGEIEALRDRKLGQYGKELNELPHTFVLGPFGMPGDVLNERLSMLQTLIATAQRQPQAAALDLDVPDQLRELSRLRDEGILTQAEFESKKTELLSRM